MNETQADTGPAITALTSGTRRTIAERREQTEIHGYDETHDDAHEAGELVDAAIAYLLLARSPGDPTIGANEWPWPDGFKVGGDPRQWLAKAAAFAIAEIDRLDRKVGHRRGPLTHDLVVSEIKKGRTHG